MATAARWQAHTMKPMAMGARMGMWGVLCPRFWSVATSTTNTRAKVRIVSSSHPALGGRPLSSRLAPPVAAAKPVRSVCAARAGQAGWGLGGWAVRSRRRVCLQPRAWARGWGEAGACTSMQVVQWR